ncbi:hypothetical protein V492_01635 [Pseudogymnoascus sp. VKM F-4246]|nr:hypothetical protein V492_01635 [Pseudogymnoascus sp. VKM F-4246]
MPFNPIDGATVRPHDRYRWRSLTDQYSTTALPLTPTPPPLITHDSNSTGSTIKDIGSNRAALQFDLLDVRKHQPVPPIHRDTHASQQHNTSYSTVQYSTFHFTSPYHTCSHQTPLSPTPPFQIASPMTPSPTYRRQSPAAAHHLASHSMSRPSPSPIHFERGGTALAISRRRASSRIAQHVTSIAISDSLRARRNRSRGLLGGRLGVGCDVTGRIRGALFDRGLGEGGRGGGAGGGVWWERDGDEGAPWGDVASAAEIMRGSPSFLGGCDVMPRVKVTVKVTVTETETPQQRRAWRPHERHGNVTVHTRSASQPVRVNSYSTHPATPIHIPCPALVGVASTLKGMPSD